MPRAALMRDVFLQRTGAVDDRDPGEVVRLRRRGRRPLERVGLPWVIARRPTVAQNDAVEEVEEEYSDRYPDDVGPDRRDQVEAGPLRRLRVMERAPRHPLEAEVVHREKRHVHADAEKE